MTIQEIEQTSGESKRADASDLAVYDNLGPGSDLDSASDFFQDLVSTLLPPPPAGEGFSPEFVASVKAMQFYQASPVKRQRATKAEVESRRNGLFNIVAKGKPMTVRQAFYQATIHNIVEKSEAGYTKIQTDLVQMRRSGMLPYDWLADNTRWQRKPRTFSSVEQALLNTAKFYRKALWDDAGVYVEVWLEKDALAGVVYPITELYDVPLMVARGYASLSFLHEAAEYIDSLDVPTFIYHFGDFDPSGVNAAEKIDQTLREMAPLAEIEFRRVAVTHEQIAELGLPTRPTKTSDSRSRNFGEISVELDAINPNLLRQMVEEVITEHLPVHQFEVLKAAEDSERNIIQRLVGEAIK